MSRFHRIIGGKPRHVGGRRPSMPDHRMLAMMAPAISPDNIARLPQVVDLETCFPPVNDQGQAGTCLANSFAEIMEQCEHPSAGNAPTAPATAEAVAAAQAALSWQPFSRRFIYDIGRLAEQIPLTDDSGLEAHATWVACQKSGVCYESTMPYSDTPEAIAEAPSVAAYNEALLHRPQFGFFLPDGYTMLQRISQGFGVAFGMSLPRSFESSPVLSTGDLEPPGPDDDYIGGHEMVAIGFDRRGATNPADWWVKVRNSWGTDVGVRGNFRIRFWYWLTMTPSGAVADPGITISKVPL